MRVASRFYAGRNTHDDVERLSYAIFADYASAALDQECVPFRSLDIWQKAFWRA
jgi:hypothetical protein